MNHASIEHTEGLRLLRNVLDDASITVLSDWVSRAKRRDMDKPVCILAGKSRTGRTCLQFAIAMAIGGDTRFVTFCELSNASLATKAMRGASLLMMSDGEVMLERLNAKPGSVSSVNAISGLSKPLCIVMNDDPTDWLPKEFLEQECVVLQMNRQQQSSKTSQIHVRDEIAAELVRWHESTIGGGA